MAKEGNELVAKYKELDEQSRNPVATPEAKAKIQTDGQKVLDDIRRKQAEVQKEIDATSNGYAAFVLCTPTSILSGNGNGNAHGGWHRPFGPGRR